MLLRIFLENDKSCKVSNYLTKEQQCVIIITLRVEGTVYLTSLINLLIECNSRTRYTGISVIVARLPVEEKVRVQIPYT